MRRRRPKRSSSITAYVAKLSGLSVDGKRIDQILTDLGFEVRGEMVTPPTWRRDVDGKADLVEEVARIEGFGSLPSTPLPEMPRVAGGVLTVRQARMRNARRAMAARGYAEAVTWSFMRTAWAQMFGGGDAKLVLTNPIASDLDCMRPSILPNLIEAAARNARQGFADAALFEVGPAFRGDQPQDQRTIVAGLIAPHPPRSWEGVAADPLFALKADLMALLDEMGAPTLAGGPGPGFCLVASRSLGPVAAWPEDDRRRVRRTASAGAEGPRRRRARCWRSN